MNLNDRVKQELERRRAMWARLLEERGPRGVAPRLLRGLRIYGGAQGIWVDKARTGSLTGDSDGVTVGLLHTGTAYPDDLSDDGILYHYPETRRPRTRDLGEINATKSAGRLGLPVFVVTYPSPGSSSRDVHMGWVEDWDDESRVFLVTFGDEQPPPPAAEDDEPFELVEETKPVKREVASRKGQQRFKFRVFRRYGPRCAVCDMGVPEVLDAVHIRPKKERGTDDPRNGLVLCVLHHRALDAGLFAVHPDTLAIYCPACGPDATTLRIAHPTLEHLHRKPHRDALEWLWERWERKPGPR